MKYLPKLIAVFALFMTAAPALAHTTIVSSNIEHGEELTSAPDVFKFSFGDEVGLAGLELETLEGEAIDIDFERSSEIARGFSVPLPTLEPGDYIFKWRAVAKDGHVMRGELDFTVAG